MVFANPAQQHLQETGTAATPEGTSYMPACQLGLISVVWYTSQWQAVHTTHGTCAAAAVCPTYGGMQRTWLLLLRWLATWELCTPCRGSKRWQVGAPGQEHPTTT